MWNARTAVSALLAAAGSDIPAAPVIGLMTLGVVVALLGHIARSYKIVGVGVAVLFLATAAMILGAYTAFNDDSADPRPCEVPARAAC